MLAVGSFSRVCQNDRVVISSVYPNCPLETRAPPSLLFRGWQRARPPTSIVRRELAKGVYRDKLFAARYLAVGNGFTIRRKLDRIQPLSIVCSSNTSSAPAQKTGTGVWSENRLEVSDDEEEDHHGQAPNSFGRGVFSEEEDGVNRRAVYEVFRITEEALIQKIYVKRRDLLRAYRLQPRDLRRLDPFLSVNKTSPNITVKENCLLINLGGIRALIQADNFLLFEPYSLYSQNFLDIIKPRLSAAKGNRLMRQFRGAEAAFPNDDGDVPPFELEMLECALMVATGRLDAEMLQVTKRVSVILQMLPKDITPSNLEELRRVKQLLVELESKADTLRNMLEELMDDEEEVREVNLSSRPVREEKRRQREKQRLNSQMEREQQFARRDGQATFSADELFSNGGRSQGGTNTASQTLGAGPSAGSFQPWEVNEDAYKQRRDPFGTMDMRNFEDTDSEGYQEGKAALEEMEDAEAEEREVEEVEDLLEYYLQRAATTQIEAERLLAGARDLEESIAVSLSARRFEVNRLELTLSIGSFAAALGAMIAGIFGMNLRSTLEQSVLGFWGTAGGIVCGFVCIALALFSYTRRKRIL